MPHSPSQRIILCPLLGAIFAIFALLFFYSLSGWGLCANSNTIVGGVKFPLIIGAICSGVIVGEILCGRRFKGSCLDVFMGFAIAFSCAYPLAIVSRALLLAHCPDWTVAQGTGMGFNPAIWVLRSLGWGIVCSSIGVGAFIILDNRPSLTAMLSSGFAAGILAGLWFDPMRCGMLGQTLKDPMVGPWVCLGLSGALAGFFAGAIMDCLEN